MMLLVSLLVRSLLSVALAVVGGFSGYFAAWMLLPPSFGVAQTLALLTTGVGIGSGVGGFLAWIDPEDFVARLTILNLGLAVLGGMVGAWATGLYGHWMLDRESLAGQVRTTTVLIAAIGAMSFPLILALWIGRRQHPE